MRNKLVESNPNIMDVKPTIAGTRIKVKLVLEKLARGESIDQILYAHPRLSREAVMATLELPLNYRYMNDYPRKKFWKMQYACFNCRKTYKQTIPYLRPRELDRERFCPQCRSRMWMMGVAFKAPKQTNIKQWTKVETLIRSGFIFHSTHYGWKVPKVPREVKPFLRWIKQKSEGERLLDSISEKTLD
ncbi:MAG: DUF433 domain-containing protein [Pyrinomonadaceae bacterium MAG19_C2-C3]|nr:DUF433 domain-containing protein [Pyrinomonadaceae bacterium MAG19_C2-C3]